ncbi:DUF2325 domain-containing protein [Tindallia californiensis]|uniref:DUF2325 domain-containing protein n=1 Tax=Tindallia californiensis TaxID=159292 RepID=A0A1H3J6N4_9FIRM|nr:DUF2325 domain-containing protein [Tindallia californiensis]SDY35098.1 hypothetical protein SAMN05192546_101423 [Tindallia californiensis]
MKALLVGADRLGSIPNALQSFGIEEYVHWTGRKKGMRKMDIPEQTDLVIIFTDFIEHNMTQLVKEKAKQMSIPCVFSKRASSDLIHRLEACKHCPLNPNNQTKNRKH